MNIPSHQKFLDGFQTSKKAIKAWLLSNIAYQGNVMTDNELEETSNYYAAKLDVYDVEYHKVPRSETRWNKYFTFKVRVGKPKFRGTVNYTLAPHSLLFNTKSPTAVKFCVEVKEPSYHRGVIDAHFNPMSVSAINRAKDFWIKGNYSAHPHINDDGSPCLGGWGNAWAQTINSSNILSLVPVAQSFLNTWTADDSYWNINYVYRCYRQMPLWMRKLFPFGEFNAFYALWRRITSDSHNNRRCIRISNLSRWLAANQESIQELVRNGMDFQKLCNLYWGAFAGHRVTRDTEDERMSAIYYGKNFIEEIWFQTKGIIDKHLHAPDALGRDLACEAMVGKPKAHVPKPWSLNQSDRTFVSEMNYLRDYTDNKLRDYQELRYAESGIELSYLLEYQRNMNRKQSYSLKEHLTQDDITMAIEYYVNSRIGTVQFDDLVNVVNSLLEKCDIDNKVDFDSGDSDVRFKACGVYANALVSLGNHFTQMFDEDTQVLAEDYAYTALDNYESVIKETITKRIHRGKNKIKPGLHRRSVGDDSQQSQLSAF